MTRVLYIKSTTRLWERKRVNYRISNKCYSSNLWPILAQWNLRLSSKNKNKCETQCDSLGNFYKVKLWLQIFFFNLKGKQFPSIGLVSLQTFSCDCQLLHSWRDWKRKRFPVPYKCSELHICQTPSTTTPEKLLSCYYPVIVTQPRPLPVLSHPSAILAKEQRTNERE